MGKKSQYYGFWKTALSSWWRVEEHHLINAELTSLASEMKDQNGTVSECGEPIPLMNYLYAALILHYLKISFKRQ